MWALCVEGSLFNPCKFPRQIRHNFLRMCKYSGWKGLKGRFFWVTIRTIELMLKTVTIQVTRWPSGWQDDKCCDIVKLCFRSQRSKLKVYAGALAMPRGYFDVIWRLGHTLKRSKITWNRFVITAIMYDLIVKPSHNRLHHYKLMKLHFWLSTVSNLHEYPCEKKRGRCNTLLSLAHSEKPLATWKADCANINLG